jgi:hypothetical protein
LRERWLRDRWLREREMVERERERDAHFCFPALDFTNGKWGKRSLANTRQARNFTRGSQPAQSLPRVKFPPTQGKTAEHTPSQQIPSPPNTRSLKTAARHPESYQLHPTELPRIVDLHPEEIGSQMTAAPLLRSRCLPHPSRHLPGPGRSSF